MSRHRLRGTWEEDPAPLPFPSGAAGRSAGADEDAPPQRFEPGDHAERSTDALIEGVEAEMERLNARFRELRSMLTPFEGEDPPPAA
ncbi:MAG: hypothetical protein ACTS22_09845 [Phycisphaerales bacterium]